MARLESVARHRMSGGAEHDEAWAEHVRIVTPAAVADPARIRALEAAGLAAGGPIDAFAPLARLAARALQAPLAQVNCVTARTQIPIASATTSPELPAGAAARLGRPIPLELSICQHVVGLDDRLIIPDARQHPLVRHSRATTECGIRAYAGAPLRTAGGHVLGSLCVIDFAPREWTREDEAILDDLARTAADELELRMVARGRARASRRAGPEGGLRDLADMLPTLAFTMTRDGAVDWCNARWLEYTGLTEGELRGAGWEAVQDPEARPHVADTWRAARASGEPLEITIPLRGRDGAYRPFLTRITPVRGTGGDVERWFGTSTDITHEHAARVAAEDANRARGRFLAAMSHELRTPLNAIQGYTELLTIGVRGSISDEQKDDLDRITRASQYLMNVVTNALSFARLESGQERFDISPLRLAPAVSTLFPLVASQAAARGVACRHVACAPELHVRADAQKLQQILLNLLTNAIKATGPGGEVVLESEADADRPLVHIRVRDTGRGIEPAHLAHVFEPFARSGRQRRRDGDRGVGLGLAIGRDLARGMGGELSVQSEAGIGSTFTLTLRRADP